MATQYIEKFLTTAAIPPSTPSAQGIGAVGGQLFLAGGQPINGMFGKAQYWFVDPANGGTVAQGKTGSGWSDALTTVAAVFGSAQAAGGTAIGDRHFRSGDFIFIAGKVQEQLTTPVQVFDVTVVGLCNRPRHADAEPAGGNYASSTWTTPASPAAATPLLQVMQQGWRFINLLFAGPSDAACVLLYRDGGSGDDERDASHAEFHNCRFASGQDGIEQSGGAGHVGIYGCFFTSLTGVAIKHTGGAGIGFPIRYEIKGNRFNSCPSIMTAVAAQDYRIQDNSFIFAAGPTLVFDFTGGARNAVVNNFFNIAAADFDPAGGVTGSGATDVWSNTLTDAIETGAPTN